MLKNLVTDLKYTGGNTAKNLRYGKDRLDQGNSGQPYIVKDIPSDTAQPIGTGGPDFLLRGGYLVPGRVKDDLSRLTKMFFDKRSFNGLGFIAKQNVLSASGVRTQSSKVLSEGGYLPTSTLAQVLVGTIGGHVLKQGLDPSASTTNPSGGILGMLGINDPLRINAYLYNKKLIEGKEGAETNFAKSSNRLIQLAGQKIYSSVDPTQQVSTSGLINFISQNNLTGNITNSKKTLTPENNISLSNDFILSYNGGPQALLGIGKTNIRRVTNTTLGGKSEDFTHQDFIALTPSQLYELVGERGPTNNNKPDFRAVFDQKERRKKGLPIVGDSNGTFLDYTKRFDTRYSFGKELGAKRNRANFNFNNTPADLINAYPIYQSSVATNKLDDLIDFRIGILDNNNPSVKNYMHFRAYIDNLSDNYSAEWENMRYMGRGENFYKYKGFDREINLGWTVAALSRAELIPMYQKLNYLASSLAPDYSSAGYMRGNLISLTVGGWCYEQLGVLMGINYTVPNDSPWDIGRDLSGEVNKNVKQLPQRVQVSGFQFKPIHNFVPKINAIDFAGGGTTPTSDVNDFGGNLNLDNGNFLQSFGAEQYISLANSSTKVTVDEETQESTSVNSVNNNYGNRDGSLVNDARNYIPYSAEDQKAFFTEDIAE